jgi:hypothetical protein
VTHITSPAAGTEDDRDERFVQRRAAGDAVKRLCVTIALVRWPHLCPGAPFRLPIWDDRSSRRRFPSPLPRADPDPLNVREVDEPADTPLVDNRPFVAPVSDAGGLATAPVCGQAPIRLETFGPEIPYAPPS